MTIEATPGDPEATELSEDGAAQALLEQWGVKETDDQPDTPEASAAQDDPEQEQSDAQGEDGSDEPEVVEIDVAGTKLQLPKGMEDVASTIQTKVKEIESGANRRFEEAASVRKSAEAEMAAYQQLTQFANQNMGLVGKMEAAKARVEQLKAVDLKSLAAVDPQQAQALYFELSEAREAAGAAEREVQQAFQAQRQKESELAQQISQRGMERLKKAIPDFGPEKGSVLMEYAKTQGVSDYVLERANFDPMTVVVLDKARKWDELQASKPALKKQAEKTPTLKPSADGRQTINRATHDKAITRLRKSGRVEDAAIALLTRKR